MKSVFGMQIEEEIRKWQYADDIHKIAFYMGGLTRLTIAKAKLDAGLISMNDYNKILDAEVEMAKEVEGETNKC